MSDQITIFTDGSCYPNDGSGDGGWAFRCAFDEQVAVKYGWSPNASNNSMELTAILKALQYVPIGSRPLKIYTDSTYCKNALTKWALDWEQHGWVTSTGGAVKNRELLEKILNLIHNHSRQRELDIIWIKGHAGIEANEIVDGAAGRARELRISNWKQSNNKHR